MSAFSDGGFQQSKAAAVERGRGRVVHLVGGDFQHLVFQIDGVARRARLITGLGILREAARPPAGWRDSAGVEYSLNSAPMPKMIYCNIGSRAFSVVPLKVTAMLADVDSFCV